MTTLARHAGAHHGGATRTLTILGVFLVVVSSIGVGALAIHKHAAVKHEAEERAREVDRGPNVLVTKIVTSPARHEVTLPAETRGYFQATLYAKISGYVREVRVDKGDHIKRDEVLATIDSPETDQAVRGAQSDLALRRQLAARAQLLAPNVMSAQDLETANANLAVSQASMRGALALQSYEAIRAPFDGIVTMRYVDPGALLPAATGSTTSAQPLVDVADPTRLRIDAYPGQDSANLIHAGTAVTIWQDDPSHRVEATVTRVAGALDPRTRTMLCEIELDNAKSGFIPGTFTHVTFHVDAPALPIIPAEALLLRSGDEVVAVVRDGHVHMTKVTSGVTDGRTMQIVSGLHAGEMVALNLPAEVSDGAAIQTKEKPPPPPPGTEDEAQQQPKSGGQPSSAGESAPAHGSGAKPPPSAP
jgi:RND family efflux transporter MFP subunit